jgi:hypothetical protein
MKRGAAGLGEHRLAPVVRAEVVQQRHRHVADVRVREHVDEFRDQVPLDHSAPRGGVEGEVEQRPERDEEQDVLAGAPGDEPRELIDGARVEHLVHVLAGHGELLQEGGREHEEVHRSPLEDAAQVRPDAAFLHLALHARVLAEVQ